MPVRRDQPHQREAEGGLAGAGFADDAERSAPGARSTSTPSTALTWPTTRRSRPRLIGNQTLRSSPDMHHRRATGRTWADRPSARRRAGAGYRRAAGWVKTVLGRPGLDDPALGHHADPLRHPPDDAEVVGDEQHRHAGLGLEVAEELQDLRLDRHVERRGRLVGDEEVRACWRAPWRSSPAGAGRRRAGADRRRGGSAASRMPTWSSSSRTRRAAALSLSPWWSLSTSPTCRSMVWSGLSEVIGSWKTMPMSLPRTCAELRARAPSAGPCP